MTYPRIAFLSDIHANRRALEAVLRDIFPEDEPARADEIWCLGDLLGYGPDPVEVVHLACGLGRWPAFKHILGGNHDGFFSGQWSDLIYFNHHGAFCLLVQEVLLRLAEEWPDGATCRAATPFHWAQQTFDAKSFEPLQTVAGLVQVVARHSTLSPNLAEAFFHYVYPWKIETLQDIFTALQPRVQDDLPYTCYFFGHTHIPLFCQQRDEQLVFHDLRFNEPQPIPRGVSVLNPGSVGQPRGDVNAGAYHVRPTYVILDPTGSTPTVEFRRVFYDRPATLASLDLLADVSDQYASITANWARSYPDTPLHPQKHVEHLRDLLNNAVSWEAWGELAGIYRPQSWGWEAVGNHRTPPEI